MPGKETKILIGLIIAAILGLRWYQYNTPLKKAERQAMVQARQNLEDQDIARIAKLDQSQWNLELIGKPYAYLSKLGLVQYDGLGETFGIGVQHVFANKEQAHLWFVVETGGMNNTIKKMSPMLEFVPPK